MPNVPSIIVSPVEILLSATHEHDEGTKRRFKKNIELLYRFKIFKPLLDLCATLVNKGRLNFIVKIKKNYDLDLGNCRTVDAISFDSLFNRFRHQKKYTITLNEIHGYIIIHEISHLIEKEVELNLNEFQLAITADLQQQDFPKAILFMIKDVMFEQVKKYPENQRLSEVFARFFELISRSKDIAGVGANNGYYVKDFRQAFSFTAKLIEEKIFNKIIKDVDPEIAKASESYILKDEDIKHEWSNRKVDSIHVEPGKSSWSKHTKSIHDQP